DDSNSCRLTGEAAEGLDHMHQHNIVHVDMKASNVFIAVLPDGNKCAKVADLGLALREFKPAQCTTYCVETV
ncbi:unnamed protein product, partial [Sphacelaria rigidula]